MSGRAALMALGAAVGVALICIAAEVHFGHYGYAACWAGIAAALVALGLLAEPRKDAR